MAVDNLSPTHRPDASRPDGSGFRRICNHCWHPDKQQPQIIECCRCGRTRPKASVIEFKPKALKAISEAVPETGNVDGVGHQTLWRGCGH